MERVKGIEPSSLGKLDKKFNSHAGLWPVLNPQKWHYSSGVK